MIITNDVKCAICYDTAKCKIINLKCGHAFGKSCMQTWMGLHSDRQKKCLFCEKQLTNDDIKEINKIPLQERVVTISKQAGKIFCQNLCRVASAFVDNITFTAIFGGVTWGVTRDPALIAAIAAGCANSLSVLIPAQTAGAAVGIGTAVGAAAVGAAGVAVRAVGAAAGGAVGGATGWAVQGSAGWTVGGVIFGMIGAELAYQEHRKNPIVL